MPAQSGLIRPTFDSCLATSALRRFSMKLERLLFSALANARSLAFKVRSILREIVVSFILRRGCYNVGLLAIKKYLDLLSP